MTLALLLILGFWKNGDNSRSLPNNQHAILIFDQFIFFSSLFADLVCIEFSYFLQKQ